MEPRACAPERGSEPAHCSSSQPQESAFGQHWEQEEVEERGAQRRSVTLPPEG